MSKHSTYFGGSPGPPRNQRPSRPQSFPVPYGHPDPRSHGQNVNGSPYEVLQEDVIYPVDQFYFSQPFGENPNNVRELNPYPYRTVVDPYYYGNPATLYYGPGSQYTQVPQAHALYAFPNTMNQVNEYSDWSPCDYPPQVADGAEETERAAQEGRSSSNESVGKSRRFSKQRNIKDSSDGNYTMKATQKKIPKHEIRFSHQKNQDVSQKRQECRMPSNDANLQQEDDRSSGLETSKFSIIRSIGNRDVDTGFTENQSENAMVSTSKNSKPSRRRNERASALQTTESQISVLLEQLTSGTYECMVCCDRVKQQHAIWNCEECHHAFHMGCIKKWARSPAASIENEGWRCPGCQNISKKFPSTYKCFCGKVNEPDWNRRETPHSCGEICGKKRKNNATCTHPCNILCHPGPCPACPASVIKACLCGKMTRKVRCSQVKTLKCLEQCGKKKNCCLHICETICHAESCESCEVNVEQTCFCGKALRSVLCGSEQFKIGESRKGQRVFSCEGVCDKLLDCGNHYCESVCHPGDCKQCSLLPSVIKTCPCTQTLLVNMADDSGNKIDRKSCEDPIPECGKTCGKPLKCGGEEIHTCQLKCHSGECPPCPNGESTMKCRCGKSEKDVSCSEITDDLYICDRRCNKKRKCGRHKCGKTCCTDNEHVCSQPCGRKLECKLHRCEETCHRGVCHTCYNVSFEELSCHCGAEVLFPPIQCSTKPPECANQCTRSHPCNHNVNHNCHNEEKCPPCVVLVNKPCNCGKVIRKNIPCHQENVSCGDACKRSLPCGHRCPKPCHKQQCLAEDEKCKQPCSIMRVECIHPCANPCHEGASCPRSPCKAMVTLRCSCGLQEKQVECFNGGAMYQRLSSEAIAMQQHKGHSVDISPLFSNGSGKQRMLQCNEECSTMERNRRLAEALNIKDPDMTSFEPHVYSTFLLNYVKQDHAFVRGVEQDITNLVEAVEWLDKNKRNHAFPPMRREKRQVVHDLAEAFQCKSLSCDEEPNRSVTVTAVRGVSKIPRTLLSDTAKKSLYPFPKNSDTQTGVSGRKPVEGKKRLLSSMKLVSMTSSSPGEKLKFHDLDQETKRPVSIPRIYPGVGKLSSLSAARKPYGLKQSDHSSKNEGPSDIGIHNVSSQSMRDCTNERQSEESPASARMHIQNLESYSSSAQKAKAPTQSNFRQPDIDYFDMTE